MYQCYELILNWTNSPARYIGRVEFQFLVYQAMWFNIPTEKWLNYLQTVEILIRRRILIWVSTVCQLFIWGFPD